MVAPLPVPIDQRFAQLIQQFGLTKNSFAMSLGKTASVVQHLIDGRNKPGYDLLCKVFEIYPNVSRDWLLLGRGPMLVSGGPASKLVSPAAATTPEQPLEPLEPLDLSEIEVPPLRRPAPSIAGSRLQPAEIAATLALAAAVQPVRTSAPTSAVIPVEPTATSEITAAKEAPVAPVMPEAMAAPVPQAATVFQPQTNPATPAASTPVVEQPAPMPTPIIAAPEQYLSGALHAQHLHHQLAIAEMRNQHLLEQQQMLREMLAMARQAMV